MRKSKRLRRKQAGGSRPLRLALLLGAIGPTLRPTAAGAAPDAALAVSKEYQIKAAYLYNFTKFVEWPVGRFPAADSPIVIGLLGENPFGGELGRIVKNRKVNGRSIVVKTVTTAAEAAGVDVLFVPAEEEARSAAMLRPLEQDGVLTVGETAAFAALGGVIHFVPEGDRIRFAVDIQSAERARLKLSAQLLKLAIIVHR